MFSAVEEIWVYNVAHGYAVQGRPAKGGDDAAMKYQCRYQNNNSCNKIIIGLTFGPDHKKAALNKERRFFVFVIV
ncbi:MAG: hypothetical protein EOO13_14075 [Chitinophagaceae bacterium]|nr:MAG: hypothetical protein EOO13_14075 [Chitinophagaceae bacterium]